MLFNGGNKIVSVKFIYSKIIEKKYGLQILDLLKKFNCELVEVPEGVSSQLIKQEIQKININEPIVLIGGPSILPFAVVPNPAFGDGDSDVETDQFYASGEDLYQTIRVVSRIPDENINSRLEVFENILYNQLKYLNYSKKLESNNSLNYSAYQFVNIENYMDLEFNFFTNRLTCPLSNYMNIDNNQFSNKNIIYFNMHGTKENGNFYGQDNSNFPIAFTPQNIVANNGSSIFTEACYGGYLDNRNVSNSIPLSFLYHGASNIVCSSRVAYGSLNPPIYFADLLGYFLFNGIKSGLTIGEAFKNAKNNYCSKVLSINGHLTPEDQKTILEFNLYGIPTFIQHY